MTPVPPVPQVERIPQGLVVEGVTVTYGSADAVADVSLRVTAGSIVGLVGANGAGKTTLLDAISGLAPVASGRILLRRQAVTHLAPHRRAALGLGRTFQAVELFADLTVEENLLVAAEAAGRRQAALGDGRQRVARAAVLAGVAALASQYPRQLTHAHRGAVSLARALAGAPEIVLVDEPAAGLDGAERDALADTLREVAASGVGILLVDHDLDLVLGLSDEVSVLDAGSLIAQGPPDEVRSDPAVITAYLGTTDATAGPSSSPNRSPFRRYRAPERDQFDEDEVAAASRPAVLDARGLTAGYGSTPIVHDIDLQVGEGEVVALLGRNGAGKTTTLRALCGVIGSQAGSVEVLGRRAKASPYRLARRGLAYVPEERGVFEDLTVADNLSVGGRRQRWASILEKPPFSLLEPLLDRRAALLSGGQRQLLVLARAFAGRPKALVVDELSLGLSPAAARQVLAGLVAMATEEGVGTLLVEQHVGLALSFADRAYVMERGRITLQGTGADLAGSADLLQAAYLGPLRQP